MIFYIMVTVDRAEWDEIYAALARDERRELLRYLKDVQVAQFEEVAQHLLKRENGSAEEKPDAMRIRLHHVHLPKLVETGVLTWDSHQNLVSLTTLGSQLPAELTDPSMIPSPSAGEKKQALD